MTSNLTAQQRANQKQNEKRASLPKYTIVMTAEEGDLLNKLAEMHGSKKSAIIAGLLNLYEINSN